MPNFHNALRAAGLATLLAFCSTSAVEAGKGFEPVEDLPEGKAVFYLYRLLSGVKTKFSVKVDDDKVGVLKSGNYLSCLVDAGDHEVSAKVKFKFMRTGLLDQAMNPATKLPLGAEAGTVYYVRGDPSPDGQKLHFVQVDNDAGYSEIRGLTKGQATTKGD